MRDSGPQGMHRKVPRIRRAFRRAITAHQAVVSPEIAVTSSFRVASRTGSARLLEAHLR